MENNNNIYLSDLQNNETAVITNVAGQGAFRKRITEMGFVKGKRVKVIKNAPLQDPVEYEIMGYNIALRRSEAALIKVNCNAFAPSESSIVYGGTLAGDEIGIQSNGQTKKINVALVGNPNCG